ncbi:sensor domain-containing diguanylate cyclase [Algisphaera agarilytica]|uniref:diguanylate cyclase n=1 Tax=Algisphaera agarilytica TaxID=1385975 RepID=A0A7X0HBT5_9BACT|nr:HDOD domain-containing protein [Algisphaera agarilytica]MBB6431485.1 diguanylate cyclase (GGDEF)-like protein [Algisphaera agarilytica]
MNEQLLERVLQSPRLPSLPTIALEVIDLVQQKNVDIKQIADTIKMDPALSSKILKTVNSSFYGQAYSISTISHALVVLGLNSVKTLALGFSLVNNLADQGGDGFDHMEFWKRSLFTATASKALAQKAGVVQQEEAFLGGLLQDLGMLTMNQTLGNEYNILIAKAGTSHAKLQDLEREQLDLPHPEVGAKLAESWSLPKLLSSAIRFHHDPDASEIDTRPVVQCVALGNLVADVFVLPEEESGAALENYRAKAQEWCNIPAEECETLLKDIHKLTKEMQRLFDLPTGGLGNADDILASANEALLNLTMQAHQESSQLQEQAANLQEQNQKLEDKAYTDQLTGSANRRAFDEYVEEQFQATTGDAPLTILFMDIDKFKVFNDTHGHAVGDEVLVKFAQVLEAATGDQGRVFRYGGEEYSIICPSTSRLEGAKFAEHIRATVEADCKITKDDGTVLGVTCSIGVACHEGETFNSAEVMIKASDMGVYAAKEGGRNCVRVFTPRKKAAA